MLIKSGRTRVVFIFDNIVIKVPRIPLVSFFSQLLKHSKENTLQHKINTLRIDHLFILRYFLMGFFANRTEYRYSKKNPLKKGIIPINTMILGCILIQPTGIAIDESDKRWKRFHRRLMKKNIPQEADVHRSHNYSRWKNRICLHDYGSPFTTRYLNTV